MTDLIQLKESSYKGVAYLAKTMPTSGGRRVNVIRFPGSDKQKIEDQGLIPRQFSITGVIPHDNYLGVRDSLIRVFEDGKKGPMVHPTFGEILNVRNGKYQLTETTTKLGRAEFTVEFFIDDAKGVPVSSANTASKVQAASDKLNASLSGDLSGGFNVTNSFTGNFSSATNDSLKISEQLVESSKKSVAVDGGLSAFSAEITAYNNNVTSLIQTPLAMASSVASLFNSFNNLYESAGSTFFAIASMFGFGSDDQEFEQNTAGRIERQKNQDLIRANIKAQSLSYAYLSAVQIDFDNENSLSDINDQLEAQYSDVRSNEQLSNESFLNLDDLRIQANSALSQILLNTRKVITINTRQIPLPVLVYQYYGSLELVETIAEMNDINQRSFVSGDIRILTQ